MQKAQNRVNVELLFEKKIKRNNLGDSCDVRLKDS